MKKLAYGLLLGGLVGAMFCFYALSGEALPYQNPTPELLAAQEAAILRWALAMLVCLFGSAVGVAVLFGMRRHAQLAARSR